MSIKTRKSGARIILYVNLVFRNRQTRAQERYRRDARVQTRAGATAEERSVIRYWEEHGTIETLLRPEPAKSEVLAAVEPVRIENVKTWAKADERFREVEFPKYKPSTRAGYERLLDGSHFTAWQALPLADITTARIAEWDGVIAESKVSESTRRNHHVVLRSVLHCAHVAAWLPRLPELPPLPPVGRTEVMAVRPADVHAIIFEADDPELRDQWRNKRRAARKAFALMAWAGLRSSEVRGLRWRDVDSVRGVLVVRHAVCVGEEDTPKSGDQRTIPLSKALQDILGTAPDVEGAGDLLVAPTAEGHPWGDTALYQALQRACDRIGIEGQRAHSLRHSFVTGLFEAGIGAHTVRELAGHASLDVTQRYAHPTHEAKVEAVEKLGARMASMANVIPIKAKKAKAPRSKTA